MTEGGRKNALLILLIFAVFAAPALISWLLLGFTDIGEESGGHGRLIEPPRPLPNLTLSNPKAEGDEARLHGKWSLLYLNRGVCGQACERNLYRMRQLRLATGKHAPRVQRVLVQLDEEPRPLDEDQQKHFAGQLVLWVMNEKAFPGIDIFRVDGTLPPYEGQAIYLVDPLGNLMMVYPADTQPKGIIRDLNRLLRYSRIG